MSTRTRWMTRTFTAVTAVALAALLGTACGDGSDPTVSTTGGEGGDALGGGRGGPLSGLRSARALVADERPDLVLTYNWGSFDAVLAARGSGRPHVHHEDGFNIDEAVRQKTRRVLARRFGLRRAYRVVVPSHNLERIATATWRLAPERVQLISNGIHTDRFQPEDGADSSRNRLAVRARLGIPARALVVGTVGHLRPVKNYARLLSACAALPAAAYAERGVHVLVVGDGEQREALERQARERIRRAFDQAFQLLRRRERTGGRVGHGPDQAARYAEGLGQPLDRRRLVNRRQAFGTEGSQGFEPEDGVLGVLARLLACERRLVFQIDAVAVDPDLRNGAAPAENGDGTLDQGRQQFRLQTAVGGAQEARHFRRAFQHLGCGHARLVRLTELVGQQRLANLLTEVVEHELRDIETPGRLQRRKAGGPDRFRDDGARHQFDGGGVENAVVIGLPDAGDRDGCVLEHEFHDFVGGLDVGQRFHHRRTAVDFTGRLEPSEIDERRMAEVALRQQHPAVRRAETGLGNGPIDVAAIDRHHGLDDRHAVGRVIASALHLVFREIGFGEPPGEFIRTHFGTAEGRRQHALGVLLEHDL